MRIILDPLFRIIVVLIVFSIHYLAFLLYSLVYFIWFFEFPKYNTFFNNERSRWSGDEYKEDRNIKQTIKRYYKLNFY